MIDLKRLARNTFGIVSATAVAGLGLGAAPAHADITHLNASCPHGEEVGAYCTMIAIDTTDSAPVWVTLNGTMLGGSPFTPRQRQSSTDYGIVLNLDCTLIPLHIVAMQKNASGTITSQQSTDFNPPNTVESAVISNLIYGGFAGVGQAWQALTGMNTPSVGSASGSTSAVDAMKTGSAGSGGCHVRYQD
ncbi:hypothetical protein ACFXO9_30045 [Nocardia tengchongensis]|uniref:hypothetical protein n=1 Tax=Nocardia tengchongensis TaxID=2055889 RepID=UPI0036A7DE42